MLGEFTFQRLACIIVIGATFYAFEIPNYLRWIDEKVTTLSPVKRALQRTGLALAYFNPLWISRHLLFIAIASGHWQAIGWNLLWLGTMSWLGNIPISAIGNTIIQVKIPLKWRFFGSAAFSALMAVYYACSAVLFKAL